jgi:hypothetical protein
MSSLSPRFLGALSATAATAIGLALLPAGAAVASPGGPTPPWSSHGLTATSILSGTSLQHTYTVSGTETTATETLSNPDDITQLDGVIFAGFQNGVGPQGQPSSDGNIDSTIVALSRSGQALAQWDIQGKADGVTADPAIGGVIATVNEDAKSSLYTITPGAGGVGVVHQYAYSEPLPHGGGTDAISILGRQILISASAPGTTGTLPAPQPTFPAVYSVTLDPATSIANVTPYFNDQDPATVANVGAQQGQQVNLALTDPDSNEIVPFDAPRFGGEFMLTSQGDQEQIFVSNRGWHGPTLSVLSLSQSVDDTQWADGPGVLYATDSTNDAIDAISGDFPRGPIVAATPCGSNSAPATCPGPGFPANYLGSLNPWTGAVTQLNVGGSAFVPQGGLLFMSFSHGHDGDDGGNGDQGHGRGNG